MSKRPSPLTTTRSRAYRQRLEQMLAESNIRLVAATEALADTFQDWQQAVDMIDNRVAISRDCLIGFNPDYCQIVTERLAGQR